MKRLVKYILLFLPLTLLLAFVPACQSTYIGRFIAWNMSDIKDHEKFPGAVMQNAGPVSHYPVASQRQLIDQVSYVDDGEQVSLPMQELLNESNTTAFIVIKNDTIFFEGYASGYTRESINTSFSVAKSITSILIGIALDQQLISSRHDAVTSYLPELLESDPELDKVTLHHLLMMQSGFYYIDNDLPWGDKPKNYYGPDLRKRALNVKADKEPGVEWEYMGYNPILCGMILEEVSGMTVAEFTEQYLWSKLGMEYPGSWSLDSEDTRMAKMESGVNGRAIDFAKIGSMFLHMGQWNGDQVVSPEWVKSSTSLEGSVAVWDGVRYKDFWWVYPEKEDLPRAYAATGHLGQYIFVSPEENTVMVRFGKDKGDVPWIRLFRQLSARLHASNNSLFVQNHAKNH